MSIIPDSKPFHKTIEFPDNRLMIDLCGQLDCNLSRIEHEMSVQVLRRGNILKVSGEKEDCLLAVAAMQSLYSQIESGKSLEYGDIDAIIKMPGEFFDLSVKGALTEENNKTNDKLTYWNEDGYKLAELMLKDNVLEGKLIAWYENGQKLGEGNFNDGKQDGKQISWYENGQLKFEKNYKDGNLDGKWIEWSEDGQITIEKNYIDLDVKKLRSEYFNLIKENADLDFSSTRAIYD